MAENTNQNLNINNVKVENKKEVNASKTEFKKLNELKKDDVSKLEQVPFTIRRNKTRYGTTYSGSIPFGKGHLNFRLDENAVLLIGELRNVQIVGNETTVSSFVRYVTGLDKNGSEYYQAQVLIASGCYFTTLINGTEKRLLDIYVKKGTMKPIDWVVCPSKEVEEGLGYFED